MHTNKKNIHMFDHELIVRGSKTGFVATKNVVNQLNITKKKVKLATINSLNNMVCYEF